MRAVAADGAERAERPFDVALDADENLYVSDKGGKRRLGVRQERRVLAKMRAEVLDNPMSLAVDRSGSCSTS